MFREMRRKDRAMNDAQIQNLLNIGEYGILASQGEEPFPYAIPLSYAMVDGKIYLHCTSRESQTKDNIGYNPNVCFTIVGDTEVLPEKFSTCYESVVVVGTAKEITEEKQKVAGLQALVEKYSGDFMKEGKAYITSALAITSVIEITPIQVTGKFRMKKKH